jgi:hypothetical protein
MRRSSPCWWHSRTSLTTLKWVNVNVDNDQRTSRGQARRLFYARKSCLLIALRWMDLSGMLMDGIKKSRKGIYPLCFSVTTGFCGLFNGYHAMLETSWALSRWNGAIISLLVTCHDGSMQRHQSIVTESTPIDTMAGIYIILRVFDWASSSYSISHGYLTHSDGRSLTGRTTSLLIGLVNHFLNFIPSSSNLPFRTARSHAAI